MEAMQRNNPPGHSGSLLNSTPVSIVYRLPCGSASLFTTIHHLLPRQILEASMSSASSFLPISLLLSSSILGTYWPGEFIFQCPIFLSFHIVHRVLKARMLKWFAIPFSSGPRFIRILYLTCPSWVALHGMAHSFIELDKAVIHVVSLVSFLWLWFSAQLWMSLVVKVKSDSVKNSIA